MNHSTSTREDDFSTWLVDLAGNVAASEAGLALLGRIKKLAVPFFGSTEEAMVWGSQLDPEERETRMHVQHAASNAALSEPNLQRMVVLATQSQLIREAAETYAPARLERAH